MEPLKDDKSMSYLRWVTAYILTTEFFKNTITIQLVSVYCVMVFMGSAPDSQFALLVAMTLGFYFKKD